MNIVIIGAGEVGRYIATLLSKQKHNVVLIDKDKAKLEESAGQMDIGTQQGSGTDAELLGSLLELHPDLFLALTDRDEVNLVACSIAKHLGYSRTFARVKDNLFLNNAGLDYSRMFNVDFFINPELLVSQDIYKYILSPGSINFESFVHGEVLMRTLQVPLTWAFSKQPISALNIPKGVILGLIYREIANEGAKVIFPHGSDYILPGDEVTFIGERQLMSDIHRLFNIRTHKVENVMIVGGTLVGIELAKILTEQDIQVTLLDKDLNHCKTLAKELPQASVIQQEGTDLDFLLSKNVKESDYFIMCTTRDEVNILGALIAKEAGYENIAITLSNSRFHPLMHHFGIVHIISPKIAAANHIIGLAASKSISSLVSFYENEAEILEIIVSINSQIIGIPLCEMGPRLPRDFLIVMIQNRGSITIATGESVICPGDTIIVICNPKYFQELGNIF